jgi:hypothetical protein
VWFGWIQRAALAKVEEPGTSGATLCGAIACVPKIKVAGNIAIITTDYFLTIRSFPLATSAP